jgi:hypothetical protein
MTQNVLLQLGGRGLNGANHDGYAATMLLLLWDCWRRGRTGTHGVWRGTHDTQEGGLVCTPNYGTINCSANLCDSPAASSGSQPYPPSCSLLSC